MNQHHMPWQLSEVKVQTVGIQAEKIWTLTGKAHTHILSTEMITVFHFLSVDLFMLCPIVL